MTQTLALSAPPPPPDPRRRRDRHHRLPLRHRAATSAVGPAGRSRAAVRFAKSATGVVADSAVSRIPSADERERSTIETSTTEEAGSR